MTERLPVVGQEPGQEDTEEQEAEIIKTLEEIRGNVAMFLILIGLMVSLVTAYVRTYQII